MAEQEFKNTGRLMGDVADEIGRMPNEVESFAQKIPGMIGSLPGRMAGGMRKLATADPLRVRNMNNDRREYWSAALSDLGQVFDQRGDPGKRFDVTDEQAKLKQRMMEQKSLEGYRGKMAEAALLNARKPKGSQFTTAMKHAMSLGLKPGTVEWDEYIRAYDAKSGVNINMGPKVGTAFYTDIMKDLPDKRADAIAAQNSLARYTAMEAVLPYMGATGVGKETMTAFRSALNNYGMEKYATFIDTLGEAAGIDLFSGDQGANELFRALTSTDIVGRARELYPVSNKDMDILKEMVATLRINDPEVMKVLIQKGKQEAQAPIDAFNTYRGYMDNAPQEIRDILPPIPPLPETKFLDLDGLIPSDRIDDGMMSDEDFEAFMIKYYGVNWRDEP